MPDMAGEMAKLTEVIDWHSGVFEETEFIAAGFIDA
jgi:hypothetical protein|tara:strand:+ start:4228 stop:4335 length:108 start_codon:yes stop_codon:yes gene_type:complete